LPFLTFESSAATASPDARLSGPRSVQSANPNY
jgi:hypothetical protein